MVAPPLTLVPRPSTLFSPSAARADAIDGLHSLGVLLSGGARKPLLGFAAAAPAAIEGCLLADSAEVVTAAPKKQTSLMGFLTKKAAEPPPVEEPAAVGGSGTDEEDDPAGNAAIEDDNGPSVPSWIDSGGMMLEVLDEMALAVLSRDSVVLTQTERHWLALFASNDDASSSGGLPPLSTAAKALYTRLFARRGIAFRLSTLSYPEVGDAAAAAEELRSRGLVRLLSTHTQSDGAVDAVAASLALELLPGTALKPICVAAGLPARAPLAQRAGGASASADSSDRAAATVAEQRRLLRDRLNLPPLQSRVRPPSLHRFAATAEGAAAADDVGAQLATAAVASSALGPRGCGSGGGARLRPAQRSALVRRVLTSLGGRVVLLTEPPLASLLRAERLFFTGSYCSDISAAAAAAMGCRNLTPPTYDLPPPDRPPPPLLPSRGVLRRWEASVALAAAYDAHVRAGDEAAAAGLAQLAHDLLLAVEARRTASGLGTAASPTSAEAEAPFAHLSRGGLDSGEGGGEDGGGGDAVSLDPSEAEGWEASRRGHAGGGRTCFGWVCATVLTVHVALLEKAKLHHAAAHLLQLLLRLPFCPRRRGGWWVRLAIDRDHLAREGAKEGGALHAGLKADAPLVLAALADPHLAPADVVTLARRAQKLTEQMSERQRRLLRSPPDEPRTVTVGARRLRHGTGGRVLYAALGDGAEATCTVERLVLDEYREHGGWEGMHVETGIHVALFALLMWDVLFADPPPHAFTSRFQDAPHDLALDPGEFATARRTRLDARLDALRAMGGADVATEVRDAHATRMGVRCCGLNWERWGTRGEELAEIAGCLGGASLAAVCECFSEDYGGWRGGMPDLVVWQRRCPSGDGEDGGDGGDATFGEARLVEVKSPSDSLSDQQRAWIARLTSRGVNVEVCRVADGESTDTELLRPSFVPPMLPSQPPPAALAAEGESFAPVPEPAPRVWQLPDDGSRPRGSRLKLKRKSC